MAEIVDIQIELPSYSHSFIIRDVPLSSTILQVKTKISELCAGGPRLEGQRIIFRGRYLEDIEKAGSCSLCQGLLTQTHNSFLIFTMQVIYQPFIYLSYSIEQPQDSPCLVFHLAVHPSAWSSSPPTNSQPQAQQPRAAVTASGNNNPLAYVLYLHQNALMTLMQGTVVQTGEFMHSKSLAVQLLERNGWQWPSILDEAFPQPSEGGLKYERTIIEFVPTFTLLTILTSMDCSADSFIFNFAILIAHQPQFSSMPLECSPARFPFLSNRW